MGDEGCHVVNELLRDNTRVKSLDLRGCNIRADGAMALAALLTHNRTLNFLGLEWNGIGMLETGQKGEISHEQKPVASVEALNASCHDNLGLRQQEYYFATTLFLPSS